MQRLAEILLHCFASFLGFSVFAEGNLITHNVSCQIFLWDYFFHSFIMQKCSDHFQMINPFYSILLCLVLFKIPLSRFLTSIAAQHQQQHFPITLDHFLLLLLYFTIGISIRAREGYFYPPNSCLQFYLALLDLIYFFLVISITETLFCQADL